MTFSKGLLYLLTTIVIYLTLSFIEYFSIRYLVEAYVTSYASKLVIYLVLLIPINIFLSYILIKMIPFKPKGLRKVNMENLEALKYQNQRD